MKIFWIQLYEIHAYVHIQTGNCLQSGKKKAEKETTEKDNTREPQ